MVENWQTIAFGCFIAGLSQLTKLYMLAETSKDMPRFKRTIAYTFGGVIAYFSFVMLVSNFTPNLGRPQFILGVAGVVGWIGGNIHVSLATWIQEKLGIPLGMPTSGPPKAKEADNG